MKTQLSSGAEASIYLQDSIVYKVRHAKSYRIPQLDSSLISSRNKREKKIFEKLLELGVRVPKLYESPNNHTLAMEYIPGDRLRDTLSKHPQYSYLIKDLAKIIAKIHDVGIIHGDLTTSNVLTLKNNDFFDLVLIDFGLSFFSEKIEDRAVDIHLLFQAFESTHYLFAQEYMLLFENEYSSHSNLGKETFLRLEEVSKRGKNKH
jgi:Kae1-associated kinase Bud32